MRGVVWSAGLCLVVACTADVESASGPMGSTGQGAPPGDSPGVQDAPVSTVGDTQTVCDQGQLGPALLRRLSRSQLERTLRAVFGGALSGWQGSRLGQDPVSERGFTTNEAVLGFGEQTAREWLATAEEVADVLLSNGAQLDPCLAQSVTRECAAQVLERYAPRLFRRPVEASEQQLFVDHFDRIATQADAATGLRWALVALLQSPHAVYRFEVGEPAGGERVLSPHEVASVMSYAFTGGPPDELLLGAAEAGALATAQGRVAQARRLLAGLDGEQVVGTFFEEWLRYRVVEGKVKNDLPEFDDVRAAMSTETRRFIEEVVQVDEGGVEQLLTAPYTVLQGPLPSFYGFANDADQRATRPEVWGVGLLAQGALLAANAHVDSSSPTLRGLLVYEKLLCNAHLTPPADIPSIEPPQLGVTTTRERYEQAHAASQGCAVCHDRFDPIGFAMEHFDNAGRYRADENGLAIDTRAQVPLPGRDAPVAVDGLSELAFALAQEPAVASCVGNLWVERSLGLHERPGCLAPEVAQALMAGESFLSAFAQLAAASHMTTRATD